MIINKPRLRRAIVPLLYVAGIVVVCGYFIKNPGSKTGAYVLTLANITKLLFQHVSLVLISSLIALLIAVPLGVLVSRPRFRRLAGPIDAVINIAQTIPAIAILAIFYVWLGLGFRTALFALILKTVLPIFRNTVTGMLGVPAETIEAANGMGMKAKHTLFWLELPMAMPVIMSGIRVAMVVATSNATLAAFIGAGGLGELILTGVYMMRGSILLAGGITVALLALLVDSVLGAIEKSL